MITVAIYNKSVNYAQIIEHCCILQNDARVMQLYTAVVLNIRLLEKTVHAGGPSKHTSFLIPRLPKVFL